MHQLTPLTVIASLEVGVSMYEDTADAWQAEGLMDLASINHRAAAIASKAAEALRLLQADEGAALGIPEVTR